MKILMVTHSFPPFYSGATIQALYLAKELARRQVEVEFVTNNFNNISTVEDHEGLPVHKINCWHGTSPNKVNEFVFVLKLFGFMLVRREFDLVFFHGLVGFDTFLIRMLRALGKPTIVELTLVGSDDPLTLKNRKLGFLFHLALGAAGKIVAISSALKSMSQQSGVKPERLTQIPVGVDTAKFRAVAASEKKALRGRLGLSDDQPIFLAVGQVEARKGYDFMLQAWKFVESELSSAKLLVIGPRNEDTNPFYRNLRDLAANLKLGGVQFLGLRRDVADYLKIADCLVHCALAEGLPNTLVEATVSAVPIVCRQIKGVTSDIITSERLGREYEGSSPAEFGRLIAEVYRQRALMCPDQEVESQVKRFGMESVAGQYLRLFEELTCPGSSVSSPVT